jgi:hypothetical protein
LVAYLREVVEDLEAAVAPKIQLNTPKEIQFAADRATPDHGQEERLTCQPLFVSLAILQPAICRSARSE